MQTFPVVGGIKLTPQSCFKQEVQGLATIEAFLGDVSRDRTCCPLHALSTYIYVYIYFLFIYVYTHICT